MAEKNSKKNTKLLIAVFCLAVVVVALLVVWKTFAPKGEVGDKRIIVQVVHGDGSTRDFDLRTSEAYLGGALVEGGVVVNDQGPYGLYMQTVDGETCDQSNQEWWQVTRAGEMVNTGADSTPIADGEEYELTLTVGYD